MSAHGLEDVTAARRAYCSEKLTLRPLMYLRRKPRISVLRRLSKKKSRSPAPRINHQFQKMKALR
jgi:hypothetical protein